MCKKKSIVNMDLPNVEEETETDPVLKIVLNGHKKAITDIAINSRLPHQFATASEDGTLMVWNMNNNCRSFNYLGHTKEVTGVEYSPNGEILASSSADHSVRFWTPSVRGDCKEFIAHVSPLHCLNFSEDNKRLITGARDKAIKMWDVASRSFIQSFLGHNHWVSSAKFFPNCNIIASGADDKTLRIWDVVSGQSVHIFPTGEEGSPVHVAPYPNNNSIAVALSSGAVRIYELRAQKALQHYTLHTSATYVSWHPYDNYLLTCGKEGKVRIVDVMEGRPLYTIGGHEGAVNCAKFSIDGQYFITGGVDKYVMIWKTNFISV